MNCPSARHLIALIIFLLFTTLTPNAASQEKWHTLVGPDSDFSISFLSVPSRERKVTPQKPFTGQKMELYTYQNGGSLFSINYKDLPARAGMMNKELVLTEFERGLFVDEWLINSQQQLQDGGRQYELLDLLRKSL